MKDIIDNIKYVLGLYGATVGWILITAILLLDPIRYGIAGYFKDLWRIGEVGQLVLIVGAGLIWLSKLCKDTI